MKKIILTLVFLLYVVTVGASAEEMLTIDHCVKTALQKNPDIWVAAEKINSKKAKIGQAASDGNPQLSAGMSYARSGGSGGNSDYGKYSTNIALEQSVYDWGRRNLAVSGAKIETAAAELDYQTKRDEIIANVKESYYGLNKSIQENEIARTRYDNYEKRLEWANAYYSAGTKAKIEVTKARSDLASSKLTLVKTMSSISQYKASLAEAMGMPMLSINNIADELGYTDWSIALTEALARAKQNRPEILAQEKRVESARMTLHLQKKGLSPSLTASVGYDVYGSAPADNGEWTGKLSASIPLSDGGLTAGKIQGAAADLAEAEAEMESLSNSVVLEIRKAFEALTEAKEALAASRSAESQAKETLDLALGRYSAGVGNSLEVSDAVDSYAEAQTNTVQSMYDCKTARLDLEKAMGGLN